MRPLWPLLMALLFVPATGALGQPTAAGSEFQVNTFTTSGQYLPAVAVTADGRFIVAWHSFGSAGGDTSFQSIQAQRFAADGSLAGAQFQVNSYTTIDQVKASIAAFSDGGFIVAWQSFGSNGTDTSNRSIQAQRYDSSGDPLSDEFQVNTSTIGFQYQPSVAGTGDGDFVVAWQSYDSQGTDSSLFSVQGQRYASDGDAIGGEFQVNSYWTNSQFEPAVAVAADGRFLVVWTSFGSNGTDDEGTSVQAQFYGADGSASGGEFQVNTFTASSQLRPATAAAIDGTFLVVWSSSGSSGTDSSSSSIQARRITAAGAPLGADSQVNTITQNSQSDPTVAATDAGNFLVVWQSYHSGNSNIQGRVLDSAGDALGDEFAVNTYVGGDQIGAAAHAVGGAIVVAWQSDGSTGTDTSLSSILAQRYVESAIFMDGFESGDLSAWSATVP